MHTQYCFTSPVTCAVERHISSGVHMRPDWVKSTIYDLAPERDRSFADFLPQQLVSLLMPSEQPLLSTLYIGIWTVM